MSLLLLLTGAVAQFVVVAVDLFAIDFKRMTRRRREETRRTDRDNSTKGCVAVAIDCRVTKMAYIEGIRTASYHALILD